MFLCGGDVWGRAASVAQSEYAGAADPNDDDGGVCSPPLAKEWRLCAFLSEAKIERPAFPSLGARK